MTHVVAKRVKKKSHEKLTDVNIQHVMGLLQAESPITKKEACSILNISYNTTRLNSIIEEFVEKREYREKRKSENRGKPASKHEITNAIESFLNGVPISEISARMFRSPGFVKGIVERAGVPRKRSKEEKHGYDPYFLPDECVRENFKDGEIVWSAYYDQAAEVLHEVTVQRQFEHKGWAGYQDYTKCLNYEETYGAKCYRIYVFEMLEWSPDMLVRGWIGEQKVGFYAHSLAYDLGSLQHLESYGVDITRLQG